MNSPHSLRMRYCAWLGCASTASTAALTQAGPSAATAARPSAGIVCPRNVLAPGSNWFGAKVIRP